MSDLRQLIAKMDQIESGSMPKKKAIKEDATAVRSKGGDIIGGIKTAGSTVAKVGGKALPAIGAAMSADSAHDRLKQGDYAGSAIDAVAAGASLYPPAWPVALGASGVNMLRDKAKEVGGWGNLAKEIGQSMKDHDENNFLPENVDTLDEAGFVNWLEESGLHNLDEGVMDLVKAGASKVGPAIKSGIGKLKDLVKPAEKEIADVSAARPTDISGISSEVPGTIRVGTPAKPPEVPSAATTARSADQRQAALKDVEARMDALKTQQGKPKINAKDYEAQVAKQRELEKQLQDPRPAVWKDPRNPELPASKSPPKADVEPPAPLPYKAPKPAIGPDDVGTYIPTPDDLTPWSGDADLIAPRSSVTGSTSTSSTSNFNKPSSARTQTSAPAEPAANPNEPPEWFQNWSAEQQAAKDAETAADKPGFLRRNWGKLATGATAVGAGIGEYEREKYKNWKGAKDAERLAHPDDDFWSIQNQIKDFGIKPNVTPKTPTKESLQNKLFKEFKTFIEKK